MKRIRPILALLLGLVLGTGTIAAQRGTWTFTANGVSFKMVRVDGGTFLMGGTQEQKNSNMDEYPVHEVTLSNYAIGETEVTQDLWYAVTGERPSYFNTEGNGQFPVESVSEEDCKKFIEKLSELTGQTFRLPTEAEWEFAARGGNLSKGYLYSGSDNCNEVAWHGGNSSERTHRVGLKRPNELGLYDMSGNVWERCSDWLGPYSSGAQTNPTGPETGRTRVLRGGSWKSHESYCRVATRYDYTQKNTLGLRLALTTQVYPLWVAGQQVTGDNCDDVLGDGSVRFVPETGTLWLHNADIAVDEPDAYAIRSELPALTIRPVGIFNSLRSMQHTTLYYTGDLRITSGSEGAQISITGHDGISTGLATENSITIDGGVEAFIFTMHHGIEGVTDLRGRNYYTTLRLRGTGTKLALASDVYSLLNLAALELSENMVITEPEGARFDAKAHTLVKTDGTPVSKDYITIEAIGPDPAENRYDLNGDGAVDVSDVTTLVAYVLAPDGTQTGYDLNQDGAVDVSDVTTLVAYVLNPTDE